MVEHFVLSPQVVIGIVLRHHIVWIADQDLGHIRDVVIREFAVEVGVIGSGIAALDGEQVLEMVQLGEIICQQLVEEGQVRLQLHPLRLAEGAGGFRKAVHPHPVRLRKEVLEGEVPVGCPIESLGDGHAGTESLQGDPLVLPGRHAHARHPVRRRRKEGQAVDVEDDAVDESPLLQFGAAPHEIGDQGEGDAGIRRHRQRAPVLVHIHVLPSRDIAHEEVDPVHRTDARDIHEEGDDVAHIERLPLVEGGQFLPVDVSQARWPDIEDILRFASPGQKFLDRMERDRGADVVVHPVIDLLEQGTHVDAGIDLDLGAQPHLHLVQEGDLLDGLAQVPMLQEEPLDRLAVEFPVVVRPEVVGPAPVGQPADHGKDPFVVEDGG